MRSPEDGQGTNALDVEREIRSARAWAQLGVPTVRIVNGTAYMTAGNIISVRALPETETPLLDDETTIEDLPAEPEQASEEGDL